ncbi:MAG: 4Fe-4S dicluster domain-containing protein [Paludibacteraceae bacterium]|nr:4Fe-4S dicluster domain-containing protein [Paludibacteraceae bacterium]
MNINDPSAIQECTSCQMCGAVCPHQAITIRQNEDGFYRPYVDETICTNCGLCTKVCYKFDADVKMTSAEDGSRTKVFSAQNLSDIMLPRI